jgi:hypothetical protein
MLIAKFHLEQIISPWPGLPLMGTFALAVLQCACDRADSSKSETDWSQTTRIVYLYGDSSVPPQYHRSYRIEISPTEAKLTVDSYGTVLADKSYSITRDEFDSILNSLSRNVIRKVPQRDDEGCTGGTSETISTSKQQQVTFSGRVYHCGGEDTGDLGGNVGGFADDLRALIPELQDLLR